MTMAHSTQLNVAGTPVEASRLAKVLYSETGFTKGQVIDHHVRIPPFLLPHLKSRPIALKRWPDGVNGFFCEKQCPRPCARPLRLKPVQVVAGRACRGLENDRSYGPYRTYRAYV